MIFEQNILKPFRESIAKYGERNAFYIDGTYYTYRDFAERVSAIRGVVRSAEKNEQIWGLSLHDDLNTYASIFALWMEGKAYVPLHPSWPEERIASIKEQVGCSNVLDACDASYMGDLLDDWAEASEDDLAYILFPAAPVCRRGYNSRDGTSQHSWTRSGRPELTSLRTIGACRSLT